MNMEWDEKKWKEIFECMKSKRFNDLSKILITDPITEKQLEYLANYNITRFHNTEFMKLLMFEENHYRNPMILETFYNL